MFGMIVIHCDSFMFTVNPALICYRGRSGFIQTLSFKVGMVCLCKAPLEDKYRCKEKYY